MAAALTLLAAAIYNRDELSGHGMRGGAEMLLWLKRRELRARVDMTHDVVMSRPCAWHCVTTSVVMKAAMT